jgi:hypothetical protein
VKLTSAASALNEMMDDLTEDPLPSEEDLASMFDEIRNLDDEPEVEKEVSAAETSRKNADPLQSILSEIPSFSDMNKKS